MKKIDKDALKKAFDIPEPQHKDEFINRLGIKKNSPKRHFPIITRYASMAAFAAIMISIINNLTLTADFPDKFLSDKMIIPTISSTTAAESPPTTTTAAIVDGDQVIIQTTVSSAESEFESETKPEIIMTAASYETAAENMETTDVESYESPPTTLASEPPNNAETHTATTTVKTTSTKLTQQTTPTKTTTQAVEADTQHTTTTTADGLHPAIPQTSKTFSTTTTTTTPENNIQTTDSPPFATATTTRPSATTISTTTTRPQSVNVPAKDNDFTVRPTTVYIPSDIIVDKLEFDYKYNLISDKDTPSNDSTNAQDGITTEKLFNDSPFIFRGIIEEKIYTDVLGQPYTIENIVITDIPKDQYAIYNVNDKISIYVPGGYMPVHIYAEANNVSCDYPDNYMIYSDGGNKSTQNVGDEYFFFLNFGRDDVPYIAFQLTTNNDISVFRIDENDIVSLGNSDLTFPFIFFQAS